MEIRYRDIILRDWCFTDIEDEIRWANTDTQWMKADTPWEDIQPADPAELREYMTQCINHIPEDALRQRLEIETEGKHIGFVCTYLLDENYEHIPFEAIADHTKLNWALGIEICEPAYWCRGLGTQALVAFICYLMDRGKNDFCLETWSGNIRMIKCAEKIGFAICKRQIDLREVQGVKYDGLILALDENKFRDFAENL